MKPLTSLTKSSTESCAVDVDVPEELVRVYFSKVMISSKLIALHSTQKLKRKKKPRYEIQPVQTNSVDSLLSLSLSLSFS